MIRRTVVLFARVPRLGRGKARLARDIGASAALRIERAMLGMLRRRLGRDRRWRLVLALTPDRAAGVGRLPHRVARIGQGAGDLGARMERLLATAPPGPVVLVGADIPGLAAQHVGEAFRLLGRHDLVFGPAVDGGFWLVAARRRPRPLPSLFTGVRWSSAEALADTLAGLPRRISVGFAAMLEDIDNGATYRRLRRHLRL